MSQVKAEHVKTKPQATALPLTSVGGGEVFYGKAQIDLLTALQEGKRRLICGQSLLSLNLPAEQAHDVLIVVAEGSLLHGRHMSEALSDAIGNAANLGNGARLDLRLVLQELLSNAIEHGNLGLSRAREKMVNQEDWFAIYSSRLSSLLAGPLGRLPIRLTVRRGEGDLHVTLEDQGMGFDVTGTLAALRKNTQPTGRGLSLVQKVLAPGQLSYTQSGRCAYFRIPAGTAPVTTTTAKAETLPPVKLPATADVLATVPPAVSHLPATKTPPMLSKPLPKPVSQKATQLRRSTLPTDPWQIDRAQMRAKAKVMLVDDQEVSLKMVERMFRHAHYGQIVLCNDSRQALETARKERPDVIILDVMMPGIDGYAVCAALKNSNALKDVPVIFLTGLDKPEERVRGLTAGAADFVHKPVNPDELLARTETHLMAGAMLKALQTYSVQMQQDLERARGFQRNLLPSNSQLNAIAERHRLDLTSLYQGCDSLAGDYWTILELSPEKLAFVLVDFTGHGVIAALNTVQLHALITGTDKVLLADPVGMARQLNHQLYKLLGAESFATFIYAVLDTKTGNLSYAGGGAPPMMLRRADGSMTLLDCSGLPLGLDATIELLPRRAILHKGDTLLLLSDALTESPHKGGKRWGTEGLQAELAQLPVGQTATMLLGNLIHKFNKTVQQPVPDDLTALALTWQPPRL